MARLQISKLNNYIHILDMDTNVLYQEHSFRVFVRKITPDGDTYDVSFLRPDATPAAFYSVTIGQVYDSAGFPFSNADWEVWYQENTGDINTSAVVVVAPSTPQLVVPIVAIETGTTALLVPFITSISFASIGTVAAFVSFDGNASFVSLSPGTTINVSAGNENRYYNGTQFGWDTTAPGASLLITYNTDL